MGFVYLFQAWCNLLLASSPGSPIFSTYACNIEMLGIGSGNEVNLIPGPFLAFNSIRSII